MGVNTMFSSYIDPKYPSLLPADVQREILELTAFLYPKFALGLSVVSKQHNKWAARIIYHDLYFENVTTRSDTRWGKFHAVLQARPAGFFAENVRSIHFDGQGDVEAIVALLQVCKEITNFGLYASFKDGEDTKPIYHILGALPLRSLFISAANLGSLTSAASPDSSEKTSFNALTRLCVIKGYRYPESLFPSLTHLAVEPEPRDSTSDAIIPYLQGVLKNQNFESIVVLHHFVNYPEQYQFLQRLMDVPDNRLVAFTMSMAKTRYIEDDLWDLGKTYPDTPPEVYDPLYLDEFPGPKILTFSEMMELEGAAAT